MKKIPSWAIALIFVAAISFGFMLGMSYQNKLAYRVSIQSPTLPPQTNPTIIPSPTVTNNTTPIVWGNKNDGTSIQSRYKYLVGLTAPHIRTNAITLYKEINLSTLKYDVTINDILYSKKTEQLILLVSPASGGIGGTKPNWVYPNPPYSIAVYTTTFTSDALTKIYEKNRLSPYDIMMSLNNNQDQVLITSKRENSTVDTIPLTR